MTAKTSRELAILGVLVVVLGGVLYWNLSGTGTPTATAPQPSSNSSTPAKGKTVKADAVVIDVKLDRLARAGDTYGAAARDPFRFRPKPTPVVAPKAPPPIVTLPQPTTQQPTQKPQERIETLFRYWGYSVTPAGRAVASFTFGAANSSTAVQLVGVEGDVVEGRFRLQRIEPNAIEVVEVNGTRKARIPKL